MIWMVVRALLVRWDSDHTSERADVIMEEERCCNGLDAGAV